MANGLPYFKWYPADAGEDEKYASMNDTELGFYHRCLNKSWTNHGLPTDLDALADLMRVKRSYVDKLWVKVGRCFTETDTVKPRLVNPRQEGERSAALKKSENNKRPGNANAFGSRSVRDAIGTPRAYDSDSDSASGSSPENLREFPVSKRTDLSPSYEDLALTWNWFAAEYPGDVNEFTDRQLFLSVMETPEDIAALRENVPLWKGARGPGFHKSAKNFLSERTFKTKPKARDSPASNPDTIIEQAKQLHREKEARKNADRG